MVGRRLLGVVATLAIGCSAPPEDPSRPNRPAGEVFVLDRADLVHDESRDRMNQTLEALLRDTDIEILAISMPSLEGQAIGRFTEELFESWEVGDRTRANRGVLLVVAAEEERVRLAVSYELESIFTDTFISFIEHEQLVPYFESKMVGEGIEATVELLARRAYERIRGQAYDPLESRPEVGGYRAGGAGVETDVDLDGRPLVEAAPVEASLEDYLGPQPTPAEAWERFLEVNRRRIKDASLGLYDEATRAHLRTRPHTDAAQQHVVDLYDDRSPTIREESDRAVIFFPEDPDHLLAPWFFRRRADGWQLDGAVLPRLINYNHRNQWRFKSLDHPYMFAFHDYRFDQHGFATHHPK
jgi:hypothetical protein